MNFLIGFSLMTLVSLGQGREEYRCTYQKKVECENGRCSPSPIGTSYLVIPSPEALLEATVEARMAETKPPQIRRCDAKGCTAVDVSAEISGMFVNISSTNGGYYLKMVLYPMDQLKKGMFVESASFFLATVQYWGSCALK